MQAAMLALEAFHKGYRYYSSRTSLRANPSERCRELLLEMLTPMNERRVLGTAATRPPPNHRRSGGELRNLKTEASKPADGAKLSSPRPK